MNKARLKQNKVAKNLSLTEWRKSRPNGTRLKQNKTKGMMNETRLMEQFSQKIQSRSCLLPRI